MPRENGCRRIGHRVEHVFEPRALPARAAHGAKAPFDAGDMPVGKTAAVAGALIDGDDFDRRHLLQVVQRDLGLPAGAVAADFDLVGLGVHLRDCGQVVTDEELIVGRDRRAEIFQRRLIIRRAVSRMSGFLPGSDAIVA